MHPALDGRLPNLDEFLHIVTCDQCEKVHGDAAVAYGQALLAAANMLQNLS